MATDKIITRTEGPVGHLVFNNPARHNAMSREMWDGTADGVLAFEADDAVKVIVLSGAGGKAFVSGADISEFSTREAAEAAEDKFTAAADRARAALRAVTKPVVAAIRGWCLGGGQELALNCDIRLCTENSFFGTPAAKLGIGYGIDQLRLMISVVGYANAREIMLTGRRFTAAEALNMGLVHRVLPDDEFDAFVEDYVAEIAANAPLTLRAAKASINELIKDPAERDLAACQKLVDACKASADFTEGRTAFAEKRKPQFAGR